MAGTKRISIPWVVLVTVAATESYGISFGAIPVLSGPCQWGFGPVSMVPTKADPAAMPRGAARESDGTRLPKTRHKRKRARLLMVLVLAVGTGVVAASVCEASLGFSEAIV